MKNTFAKMFTVCALAGMLGFALSACDDSSSAGDDDNNVILSGDSREESSDSRSNDKDEAISSSGKSNDPAEVTDDSSDSKGNPSSAGTSTKSSGSEGVEGSSASVPSGSSDASVYDADKNTLKDLRDGQVYKTTTIDIPSKNYSEVWMAENLNYETDNSWCGGGSGTTEGNCETYGRLYTWAAAMDSVGEWSTSGKGCGYGKTCSVASEGSATLVRGVCPKGWHLPSQSEWEALIVAVDGSITEYTSSNTAGSKLKSVTVWYDDGNGEDTFGFSALPAGYRDINGDCYYEGNYAYFWSSTEYLSYYAYYMRLYYGIGYASLYNYYKNYGYSIRCLKDSD
ncbi:fibrobacter succinogenes major paralogous domain-containing protein [Fibrobacter sp.]|uniref:fibrobacter succinogenes major paralogous domain-containing protein n=1 Tax=Fibrobacter sp. TaxID=35828 RepID=UPI003890B22C